MTNSTNAGTMIRQGLNPATGGGGGAAVLGLMLAPASSGGVLPLTTVASSRSSCNVSRAGMLAVVGAPIALRSSAG